MEVEAAWKAQQEKEKREKLEREEEVRRKAAEVNDAVIPLDAVDQCHLGRSKQHGEQTWQELKRALWEEVTTRTK